MKNAILLLFLSASTLMVSCHNHGSSKNEPTVKIPVKSEEQALKIKSKLDQVAYMLEGSFTSEEQHNKDPLTFYNIVMHIYPIWKDHTDARWFYVEQALSSLQKEPYRQRIYRVSSVGRDTVKSTIYTLPSPERYVGAWKGLLDNSFRNMFEKLRPSDLKCKDGCEVYLNPLSPGIFSGGTKKGMCASDRKDGMYTMSDVSVSWNKIQTWDRGYDQNGEKAWGPSSGYVFDRMDKDQILTILNENRPIKSSGRK